METRSPATSGADLGKAEPSERPSLNSCRSASRARILHVITGLETGGAEMMLFRLLERSDRYQHTVVSLMKIGAVGERIAALGIPVHTLGLRSTAPNPWRVLSIRSLIHEFCPHLIQGWLCHGNLVASFAAWGPKNRVPVLWSIHQSLSGLRRENLHTAAVIRFNALLSGRVEKIVYVSEASKQQHESLGYEPSKSVVIPNGLDCSLFVPDRNTRLAVRAELGLDDHAVLIGLVARYHPMKDQGGFLRAAALVARNHPEARFALVGRGIPEQKTLVRLTADLGVRERVLLLAERQDMPRVTTALDLACSSSSWGESCPLSIVEAMACEVPCVVTDVGDSPYLVAETGLCVPPGNPELLAQAIEKLIVAGASRRQELGAAARLRIQTDFSLPITVARYEALYEKHLHRHSPESQCRSMR